MARFKFNLEQVLRYREQLEDQAKQTLSQCIAAHAACVEREQENNRKIAALERTLFNGADAFAMSEAERWLHTNYYTCLKSDAHALAAQTKEADLAVSQARIQLTQCAQDRQLLDKVKQKKLERHRHEEKLREQRQLDEITTTRREVSAL